MEGEKVSLGTLAARLISHFLIPSADPAAIATPKAVISHITGLTIKKSVYFANNQLK